MTQGPSAAELEWVQMREDMSVMEPETAREKFGRKFNEAPLVPLGCLATAAALSYGLYSFRRGDKKMSQYMMRTRIVAQGFTVVALVVGVGIGLTSNKKDE